MPTMVFSGFPLWAVLALMGASAAALWLLHRLRVQPHRVPVITTLFWRDAAQQAQAATLHKRFRHPLTYLLLLAICLLLALALGDPIWSNRAAERQWNVVVVDAGVSMNTHDDAGTWWDAARAATLSEVTHQPSQNPVAVVVCNPEPRFALRFDEPREWLALRLDKVQPAESPADRVAALTLADDLIHQTDSAGEIILVSSLEASKRITDTLTAEVRNVPVGQPTDNAALLSAVFEGSAADPGSGEVVARVGYWGEKPRNVRVSWSNAQGDDLGSDEIQLTPGAEQTLVRDNVLADGTALTLKLDTEDGLSADNQLTFQLPSRPKLKAVAQNIADPQLDLLLASSAAVQLVDSDAADQAELIITNAASGTSLPTLSIAASGQQIDTPQAVTAAGNSALVAGLSFDGDTCGVGSALELTENDVPCLMAGKRCVAAINLSATPPMLRLSPVLLNDDATVRTHPALAAFITRATRALAGWKQAIVQSADRVSADPLWAERAGVTVSSAAATRLVSDTFSTVNEGGEANHALASSGWRWFQIFIAMAVLAAGIEAFLHARARIP